MSYKRNGWKQPLEALLSQGSATLIGERFAQGIAENYPDNSAQYSAGLWHFDLPSQLLWSTSRPFSQRPKEYRAPTWSWASIDSVHYRENCHSVIEVLGDQVTLKNQTLLYGEVTFGLLALAGRVKQEHTERVEVLSLYWHFVDVVWVVVFIVVYIVGK